MLPGLDGLEVMRRLRDRDPAARLAIIVLTARGEESDRVVGLRLGADDYVVKPFSPAELVARVGAVLRRLAGAGGDGAAGGLPAFRGVAYRAAAPGRTRRGRPAERTAKAVELLLHPARQPGPARSP